MASDGLGTVRVVGFIGSRPPPRDRDGNLIKDGSRQPYDEVRYHCADAPDTAVRTRYAVHATAVLHGATSIDLLLTPEAKDSEDQLSRQKQSLANCIAAQNEGVRPRLNEPLAYTSETSQDDIFANFRTLHDALTPRDGERVILDITNGFRSSPFIAASVLAVLRATRRADSLSVVYGAFEARERATDGGPPLVPLWDLTPFIDTVDWAQDLMMMLDTGRVPADMSSRLAAAGGDHESQAAMTRLSEALKTFSFAFESLRLPLMASDPGGRAGNSPPNALARALAEAREPVTTAVPPLASVLDDLAARVDLLRSGATSLSGLEAREALVNLARLYLDTGRIVEAVCVMNECWPLVYLEPEATEPPTRLKTAQARGSRRWRQQVPAWRKYVSDLRNDLMHGGFRDVRVEDPQTLEDRTRIAFVAFKEVMLGRPAPPLDTVPQPEPPAASGRSVFVNLSNHPLSTWTEDQREAAQLRADRIVDHGFPEVDPATTTDDLRKEASRIVDQVMALAEEGEAVTQAMVHGEPVLSMLLVRELQASDVTCVAATTRRRADRTFSFVGFRPYPS